MCSRVVSLREQDKVLIENDLGNAGQVDIGKRARVIGSPASVGRRPGERHPSNDSVWSFMVCKFSYFTVTG